MFALSQLGADSLRVSLKCEPELAERYVSPTRQCVRPSASAQATEVVEAGVATERRSDPCFVLS